jgi:aryl-alcohol dehydrogenase-like predicted oxidoreductase
MSSSAFPAGVRTYSPLGRSGIVVSPLCLGTMTFGTEWGWGAPKDTAFALMERFLEAGGNFIDTADGYTNGTSEELIGEYLAKGDRRERVVLATKFTFNAAPGDPNAGGNGRKNILRALDGSLRRLRTDYVDLYWVHAWDGRTPVEEVVGTLDSLVRSGAIRHYGLSNCPAWYVARALTLAEQRGQERACALQHEYSLVERNIEREHVPAALELGLGVTAWSPLASGMLTGKYRRDALDAGRLGAVKDSGNPGFEKLFTDRNWRIVDVLKDVARQIERTPAQVALSWLAHRPAVASILIGATKLAQLEDNLGALDFDLPAELSARLEEAGRPETVHPYHFFEPTMRAMIDGGATVVRRA